MIEKLSKWAILYAALGKPQAMLSEETLAERNACKSGEPIELELKGGGSTSGGGFELIVSLCFT